MEREVVRVIITGAASGIGRAVAERLTRDGQLSAEPAELVLTDVQEQALESVGDYVRGLGAHVATLAADLADPDSPRAVTAMASAVFGGLDALVSNAGVIQFGPLSQLAISDWDRILAVNTRATFLLAQATYPLLRESRGSVVATASLAAHHPTPSLGGYAVSKAALRMLVQQLALEWGSDGIRVNSVSPGSTRTAIAGDQKDHPSDDRIATNPLHIYSEPSDQAGVIAFLLGPDARFITGADILVDGGSNVQLMALRAAATQVDHYAVDSRRP